jgi:hypothetical protein
VNLMRQQTVERSQQEPGENDRSGGAQRLQFFQTISATPCVGSSRLGGVRVSDDELSRGRIHD